MLTLILQSAIPNCRFEIDSKITNDKECGVLNVSQKIYFIFKIKGGIPLFWSSSTGYIFQFGDVKNRKHPLKQEMTEKICIKMLNPALLFSQKNDHKFMILASTSA